MRRVIATLLMAAALSASARAAPGGDSLFGTVRAVKRPDLVVFESGEASYVVRLIGIALVPDSSVNAEATRFVERLVLGRPARIRLEYQASGELVSRLLTADPEVGMNRDVGLELVEAGLARRMRGFDYKYRELAKAEFVAFKEGRGVWARR